ncbi:MAG: arginase family protein [Nanobdellota archaeon]
MKLIKIPFSGGGLGKGNGANLAPDQIENSLENIYADEDGKQCKFETEKLQLDENNITESHKKIENHIRKLKQKAILIGGDHSITYPVLKALKKKDFSLIIFDAHPDTVNNFKPPTQEDYLKVLIEEKIIKPENITLIGIRNWDEQEKEYLENKKINYFTCKQIFEKGIQKTTKKIMEKTKNEVYLSIDIDVIDITEAIGTGYKEHGGLSSRELIYMLQKIKKNKKVILSDLVEINPAKDINNLTSSLGAKILAELCNT